MILDINECTTNVHTSAVLTLCTLIPKDLTTVRVIQDFKETEVFPRYLQLITDCPSRPAWSKRVGEQEAAWSGLVNIFVRSFCSPKMHGF